MCLKKQKTKKESKEKKIEYHTNGYMLLLFCDKYKHCSKFVHIYVGNREIRGIPRLAILN